MNDNETPDFGRIAGAPAKGIAATLLALLLPCNASAWMDQWAPEFKSAPVDVQELAPATASNFVAAVQGGSDDFRGRCEGYALDLNDDGVMDHVFNIPWMGCGLNASGHDVHFIVSDGAKGRKHIVMEGHGVGKSDFVKVGGKTYFRHSCFFNRFEKSDHNHWVYQVFSFDASGEMRCGNDDFGGLFPAVTVFHEKPRFKQIELTEGDLKEIAEKTKPTSAPAEAAVESIVHIEN